jgi:hypothetical protein
MTKEQLRMQMLAGIITEGQYKEKMEEADRYYGDMEDGLYIAIDKELDKKEQEQIALAAKEKFFVNPKKIKFGENPHTGEYSVFIPNAGDNANMLDILKKFGIGEPPYTSPHLR